MSFDADTLKYLDEVKKGKPRKFAMVMKGEKIVSLIVYKKGPVEKYKKLAKEEGKGQFYYGVIDGKGQNIAFKLCRADGFDACPGKDSKLKQHLSNEAGLKFKPTYELVDELPKLTDADTEEATDATTPDATPAVEQAATPAQTNLAEQFKQRLKEILPQIKQAANTPAGDAAKQKASAAGAAAQAGDYQPALTLLDEAEQLLKEPPAATPEAAAPAQDNAADLFKSRLAELVPRIKQAAGTPAGDAAKLKASEAAVFSRKQDFNQANALLDEAEQSLQQAGDASVAEAAPPTVSAGDLKKRIKAVLAAYRAAAAAETSVSDDLTRAFARVQELAAAKQFEEAASELDVVESLIDVAQVEMPDQDPAVESLNVEAFRAAWNEASAAWRSASEAVDDQLSGLANVLRQETDEQLRAVAEFGASAISGNHRVALMAAMRDVESAPPEKLSTVIRKLRANAVQFRRHIETSPVVEAFDRNPFGLNVAIRDTFGQGFDALETAFDAAQS